MNTELRNNASGANPGLMPDSMMGNNPVVASTSATYRTPAGHADPGSMTLRLVKKNPNSPFERLPESITVPLSSTVEDVKTAIARQTGIEDFNRIGLFDPATDKTLKDRLAPLHTLQTVLTTKEVKVKDLGPQIAWRDVFLIEYGGPIIIHLFVMLARPLLFKHVGHSRLSHAQLLTFGMVVGHFVKRELETLFVHRFGTATMPVSNLFKNSAFYWLLSGVLVSRFVYAPASEAALVSRSTASLLVTTIGLLTFLAGEVGNGLVHLHLASLRPRGSTRRQIPTGLGFNLVTCPNYMFEVLSWIGVILVSRSWTVVVFIAFGAWQMKQWAAQKERAYRLEFGDAYKKKRYTMIPGLF